MDAELAKASNLIKGMMEDGDEEFPVQVSFNALKKVVAFMAMLPNTPFPDIKKPLVAADFDEAV